MKFTSANSIGSLFIVLLMMITCTKDKDETYDDESQNEIERTFELSEGELQAFAVADWNKFRKQATALLNITETNLKTLNFRTVNAGATKKASLESAYKSYSRKYESLKQTLERQSAIFKDQSTNLDQSMIKKNAQFKEQYIQDLKQLNIKLEHTIDSSFQ
ncbi:MAG: hypothetical protein EOO51_04675 [Flavobacterium sp.]|nr:MAG: hypothetical protein EOO51_04675 [Flavobacterium sp.]